MNVLVTGAAGALGRTLTLRLRRAGLQVVGLTRGTPHGWPADIGRREADITDHRAIAGVLESLRPAAVVHLAAVTGSRSEESEVRTRAVNVDGTEALLDASRGSGVTRFVFASTAAVYGDSRAIPAGEHDVLNPQTVYARSKSTAEELVSEASSTSMTSRSLRIFNIWGERFPDSLVSRIGRATDDEPVVLRDMDGFVRDYIHVDDVCDAVVHALQDDPTEPRLTLNVGSGVPVSNRLLVERMGVGPKRYRESVSAPSYSVADIGLARSRWDFAPTRLPGSAGRVA